MPSNAHMLHLPESWATAQDATSSSRRKKIVHLDSLHNEKVHASSVTNPDQTKKLCNWKMSALLTFSTKSHKEIWCTASAD